MDSWSGWRGPSSRSAMCRAEETGRRSDCSGRASIFPVPQPREIAADLALLAPAEREGVTFTKDALDALYEAADGYPYFVQAYGKVTWDVAASSPITAADVAMAAPVASR